MVHNRREMERGLQSACGVALRARDYVSEIHVQVLGVVLGTGIFNRATSFINSIGALKDRSRARTKIEQFSTCKNLTGLF